MEQTVKNLKTHIERVEAELAQAREQIVLLTEAALVREREISRLREALEAIHANG